MISIRSCKPFISKYLGIYLFMLVLGLYSTGAIAQPAFPQAEGFGKNVTGGRGGSVYHVTNLNDSGEGSLRNASAMSNVTIVFDVGGYIHINSKLGFTGKNITVAGQTAPGGIGVKGNQVSLGADNIVIRHMRFRPGKSAGRVDCLSLNSNVDGAMIDHCSIMFSYDENNSLDNPQNVTEQWTFNAWGLEDHSAGGLLYAQNVTLHHYLYAHNHTRNPKSRNGLLDFVNNTIFDWDIPFICADTSGGTHYANVDRCYFISGTSGQNRAFTSASTDANGDPVYHMWLNQTLTDFNRNGILDGTDKGYSVISGSVEQRPSRYPEAPQVETQDALTGHKLLLSLGGATPWERDEVDTLLVSDVLNQTRRIISRESDLPGISNSGFGSLGGKATPLDSDRDGMPNYFEEALALNPAVADNNGDHNSNGYTNLEEYLNWLGMPHALVEVDTYVDVDLTKFTAGFAASATYAVSNPVNGSISLLGDGTTARFTPTGGFLGFGGFKFTVNDGSSATIDVSVLSAASIPSDDIRAPLVAINCGGSAVGHFSADKYFSGGGSYSNTGGINTSNVINPAPVEVYQSEHNNNHSYTIPGLNPNSKYKVRLHFAEIFANAADFRKFDVLINGELVLDDLDLFAETGGRYVATVREYVVNANSSGQIGIQFVNVKDNAKVSGIEVYANIPTNATINAECTRAAYAGTAASDDEGIIWNALGTGGDFTQTQVASVLDSKGNVTDSSIILETSGAQIKTWDDGTNGNPNPANLMRDYFYGGTYTVTVNNLVPGRYLLYVYAHGNQLNQNATVTVDAANGGASATTTQASASDYRDIDVSPEDVFVVLDAEVADQGDNSGTLVFTADDKMNGFQIVPNPDLQAETGVGNSWLLY